MTLSLHVLTIYLLKGFWMFSCLNLYILRLLLAFAIPAIATPAVPETYSSIAPIGSALYPAFRYDDVLDLIDAIENDGFDERCSHEQIEQVAFFLSVLAKNGAVPNDPVSNALLEQDIDLLLCDAGGYRWMPNDHAGLYSIELAVSYGNGRNLLCKSWASKQCQGLKKFVKKHKTAIIIGAVLVVAVTVAVIAMAAISSASAASAVVGAGVAAPGLASNDQEHRPSSEPSLIPPQMEDVLPSIEMVQSVEVV